MNSLLIVKLSSMGDIIHALPAAQALRAAYPRAHLGWAVDRAHAAVLARQPWLDELIVHDRRNLRAFVDFIGRLRRRRWDVAVDFQGLLRSGLVTWLSGARRRVGYSPAREQAHWFYNERVPRDPAAEEHAAETCYSLAAHLGGALPGMPLARPYIERQPPRPDGPVSQLFPLYPSDEERSQVRRWLGARGFDPARHRLVAIHPHARREANLWPAANFAALARRLAGRDDLRVVLIGGETAGSLCEEVAVGGGDRLWRADGQFSLLASAELISLSAVMVTGDTGPMHLAAAVGTPLVALFGATNPLRTGPYCSSAVAIDKRLSCGHCKASRCPRHLEPPECMERISVDEVLAAVELQLAGRFSTRLRSA